MDGKDCKVCEARKGSIFCDLQANHLETLDKQKVVNVYKKGQKLFQEGDPAIGIYCIHSGKIKLTKSGQDGNEVIIKIYHHGDVLGYRSFLSKEPCAATAEALEDSEMGFIDGYLFEKFIKEDPNLAFKMLTRLSSELATAHNRIRDLSNTTVRQRLAELLLLLQKTYGIREKGEVYLDIKLTRADMAAMINSTPESVIRTLSDFQKEDVLRIDRKGIVLTNVDMLLEYCGVA